MTGEPEEFSLAALVAQAQGDSAGAEAGAHDALALAAEHGHIREMLDGLELLAGLAAAQGAWQHAAQLAGAVQQHRNRHPLHGRADPLRSFLREALDATRVALGEPAFTRAFDEGCSLSLDPLRSLADVVAFAQRSRGERSRPTVGWASLTPTERRVVQLARRGLTNVEIAAALPMGAETVKTHLSRTYAKLNVANRTQLAALARPPDDC